MDKLAYGQSVPVTSGQYSAMSPYLNFDPAFLKQDGPEYILMEGVDKNRGVSHYCYQVGLPVMIGSGLGVVEGTVLGLREASKSLGKERRAIFLNAVRDQVKTRSQPFGVLATIFSLSQFTLSQVRDKQDDLNYMVCGTTTGMLYKSTGGLAKVARGGAIGLGVSILGLGLYRFYTSRGRIEFPSIFHR